MIVDSFAVVVYGLESQCVLVVICRIFLAKCVYRCMPLLKQLRTESVQT